MTARRLRVAVVQPPLVLGRDFIDYPWFANLGAIHTAGVVRSAGRSAGRSGDHDVVLLDAFSTYGANLYPFDGEAQLWGVPVPRLLAPILPELGHEPVDVALVHCPPFLHLDAENRAFRRLLAALRAHNPAVRIILDDAYLGAMHYLDHDRAAVLRRYPEADFALQYETETLIPALLTAIAEGSALPRSAPPEQRVFRQREEPALDALPDPAWDLVSAADYSAFLRDVFDRSRRANPFRVAPDTRPLTTSRGCVYRCVFCSTNPHAGPDGVHRFRALGLETLARRVRALVEGQGAAHLNVLDQAANLNPAFGEVLALFERFGLVYDFPNGLRADHLTSEHLRQLRGRVGTLSISAESGNQRVVDEIIGKRQPLADIERVAREASALGIPLVVHYMIGLPGESRREMLDTLEHGLALQERWGAEPLVSFATPMPGTALWRMSRELGLDDRTEETPHGERVQHRATLALDGVTREELTGALRAYRRRTRSASTRKVIVNLTYRCNNRCVFCAVGNPAGVDAIPEDTAQRVGFTALTREDLPLTEVFRVLDRYYDDGVRLVDFDGGEPLLHPGLVAAIHHARRRGYERVTLTTNGRLLANEDRTCDLLASGLHELLISVHGASAEVHDALTRAPGSFRQTMAGLTSVVQLRGRGFELAVNTTVTTQNLDTLPALGERLVAMGVPAWNLQLVTPFGAATAALVPSEESVRGVLPDVIVSAREHLRVGVVNAPPCLLPGLEEHVVGDIGKSERDMVFVTREAVNLAGYLAQRRAYGARCEGCLYRPVCAGEYRF